MRCFTTQECEVWLKGRGLSLPDQNPKLVSHRVWIKNSHPYNLAEWFSRELTNYDDVLLLITEWGIWGTNENWHLYYTLRRLSEDRRFLHEAPGHFFMAHEMVELATMLQLAIINGWGGYFVAARGIISCFFSHDEFIDFYAESDVELESVRKRFSENQVVVCSVRIAGN